MSDQPPGVSPLHVIAYLRWRTKAEAMTNDELARTLLKATSPIGRIGELCEIAAERLSPGIVRRMADEDPTICPVCYGKIADDDTIEVPPGGKAHHRTCYDNIRKKT